MANQDAQAIIAQFLRERRQMESIERDPLANFFLGGPGMDLPIPAAKVARGLYGMTGLGRIARAYPKHVGAGEGV